MSPSFRQKAGSPEELSCSASVACDQSIFTLTPNPRPSRREAGYAEESPKARSPVAHKRALLPPSTDSRCLISTGLCKDLLSRKWQVKHSPRHLAEIAAVSRPRIQRHLPTGAGVRTRFVRRGVPWRVRRIEPEARVPRGCRPGAGRRPGAVYQVPGVARGSDDTGAGLDSRRAIACEDSRKTRTGRLAGYGQRRDRKRRQRAPVESRGRVRGADGARCSWTGDTMPHATSPFA